MFTGIVRGLCPVVAIDTIDSDFVRLSIRQAGDLTQALQIGDSVAIDGVCLTACAIAGDIVTYDVIKTTLSRTLIGEYAAGRLVNVERSMRADGEVGGHEVSGHVDTTAVVEAVEATPNNLCLFFRAPPQFGKYMFPRGFVAINGVSLTVSDCLEGGALFSVWLIPETIRMTNLGALRQGQRVNLEIHRGLQVIVDTIESSIEKFLHAAVDEPKSVGDRAKAIEGLSRLFLPRLRAPRDESAS